jgi:hypothetical protein
LVRAINDGANQGCGFVIRVVHQAHRRTLHRRGGGVAQVSKPVRPAAILAAVPDMAGRTAKIAICRTALERGATPPAARSASAENRDALFSIFLPSLDSGQSSTFPMSVKTELSIIPIDNCQHPACHP